MGSPSWSNFFSLNCLLFLLLISAASCISLGKKETLCHDDERSALLQFKASFNYINQSASSNSFAYPKVSSWGREEGDQGPQRSNCCLWDGVECNDDSGHVIGLDLASSCLYGSLSFSSSLFQLVHLQRLDLSDNHYNYSQIPSRLGHLTSLTYLNLSWSSFAGQIPSEISYLSKLSTLDLSDSSSRLILRKSDFRNLVQNLTNIKHLHLDRVNISSTVTDTLVNASSLTSLRLGYSQLYGEFPVSIFHLPNLQVLNLTHNSALFGYFPGDFNRSSPLKILDVGYANFSGHLSASIGNLRALTFFSIANCTIYPHVPSSLSNLSQLNFLDFSRSFLISTNNTFSGQAFDSWSWLGKLTKLYHLDLGRTKLSGDLPCFLANMTQLSVLGLRDNQITGEIPSCLVNLTQLTSLDLGYNNSLFQLKNLEQISLVSNNLSGYVKLNEFLKLKKLKILRLSFNKLSVQFKTRLSATPPKLQVLALGSCNLTEFPEFLKGSSELEKLYLSENNLHGQIPKWLWNSTRETLTHLNLSHNHLTGFEQNPVTLPWNQLYLLDLSSNILQGSLPIPPQSLKFYSVPNNDYRGEIPATFCNTCQSLTILDLSNNKLNGRIPPCFENLRNIQILKLRNNSFQGDIPQMCSDGISTLQVIDISHNRLQGKLPRSMKNCHRLQFLNLGNNRINDTFPSWLGKFSDLRVLILRFNGFHGVIGKPSSSDEFPSLSIIDLSNNGFSSMLPSNYLENWNFMKTTGGDEKMYLRTSLEWSDLASSYYEYPITIFIKGVEMQYLKTPYLLRLIDLSSNRFEGEIPGFIGNLRGLQVLNISNNSLTGSIPSSLGNLTALESLDLSQNQLSGKIPGNLAQLTFLSYFNVWNNHLGGSIPQGQQLDTFQEDAYQGNSGLCGKPLSTKCEGTESSTPPPASVMEEDEDSWFQIESDWFVVLPGAISGLIVGMLAGNYWIAKRQERHIPTRRRHKLVFFGVGR